MIELNKIYQGDALEVLQQMPDEFVDTVITSPPYFGLRSYLPQNHLYKSKEIGLEKSLEEYIEVLMRVIKEIKRVLKKEGSFWLNYGDCYGTGSGAGSRKGTKQGTHRAFTDEVLFYKETGKEKIVGFEKSLMMIPERIALRMIDDKWILRSKIVWAKQIYDQKENRTKGSVMPTSVKDRFNTSWEYLFHFVKNKKYFFDLDAVRLPIQTIENRNMGIDREKEYPDAKRNKFAFNYRVRDAKKKEGNPQFKASEKEIRNYTREREIRRERGISGTSITPTGKDHNLMNNPNGKNLPNVWLIGTEPSKELHFARFPTSLLEIPIKASCPPKGIVCDPFMGSGTTAFVARMLERKYLGIELNGDYIKLAEERLAQQNMFSVDK